MKPKEFVDLYLPYAELSEKETGISAIFILAQAAIESSWGNHAPGFNFFGIKANGKWKGKVNTLRTREVLNGKEVFVYEKFRAYDSPAEGFVDHAKFFLENPRYRKALLAKESPTEFAEEVSKAGYATDPKYGRLLRSVILSVQRQMA